MSLADPAPQHEPHERGSSPSGRRLRLTFAAVLAGLLVLAGGLGLGRATAPHPALSPTTSSAEAGFARDMQTHHQQAVELSLIVYQKTDDPAIRTLSYDIARSQSQQAGQMFGWLTAWGLPQASPEPTMSWMTRPTLSDAGSMDHSAADPGMGMAPGGAMPGYATSAQIAQLRAAAGTAADRLFLTLMIAHHIGGVEMADALLARSTNTVAVDLATGIANAQAGETIYMEQLLAAAS